MNYGYKVIAVVPTQQLYRKATKCLNKKIKVIRNSEFESFVATSLRKAPNKERFPMQERSQGEKQVYAAIPLFQNLSTLLYREQMKDYLPTSCSHLLFFEQLLIRRRSKPPPFLI